LFGVQQGYATKVYVGGRDWIAGYGIFGESANGVTIVFNQGHDLVAYFKHYANMYYYFKNQR